MSERGGAGNTRWRRTVEAMLPHDLSRRAVEHDATHAGGGYVIAERVEGPAPLVSVPDERVPVSLTGLPTIATQEQFNEFIFAAVQAVSVAVDFDAILTNADGDVLVNADGNVLVTGAS